MSYTDKFITFPDQRSSSSHHLGKLFFVLFSFFRFLSTDKQRNIRLIPSRTLTDQLANSQDAQFYCLSQIFLLLSLHNKKDIDRTCMRDECWNSLLQLVVSLGLHFELGFRGFNNCFPRLSSSQHKFIYLRYKRRHRDFETEISWFNS